MATGIAGGGAETAFCRGTAPALAPSVALQSVRRATLRVEVEPFNHARRVSRHMPNRPQVQRWNNLAFELKGSGGCMWSRSAAQRDWPAHCHPYRAGRRVEVRARARATAFQCAFARQPAWLLSQLAPGCIPEFEGREGGNCKRHMSATWPKRIAPSPDACLHDGRTRRKHGVACSRVVSHAEPQPLVTRPEPATCGQRTSNPL